MRWLCTAVYTRGGKLGQSPVDYLEPPPSIRSGRGRLDQQRGKRRVDKISDPQRDRWRGP